VEVVLHKAGDLENARAVLARCCGAEVSIDAHARRLTTPTSGGTESLVGVLRALDEAGIPLDDVALRRPTLDDVFLSLTGHGAEEGAAPEPDGPEEPAAEPAAAAAGRAS
jgi:ABC-2 type transport system ATP-binding protein